MATVTFLPHPGLPTPGCRVFRLGACALALLFFYLLSAVPADAAGPWLRVTVGEAKHEAARLLESGKATDAYRLYMSLLREVPDDPEVNMGLAAAATAAGEHNQAVLALERLVDASPRNASLRIALARAHMRVGDTEAARREFELASRLDPTLSTDIIDKVMDRLKSETSLWQVSGRISSGVLHDSNVNLGPQSSLMQFGFLTLQLDSAATSKESWGAFGMASLDVARRSGGDSPWWLVGDVALYRKGNFADIPVSRELAWGRAAAGIRHISASTLFDLRLKTEAADYISDDQQARSNGPELLFAWAALPELQLITRATLERRDYKELTNRQGWYWSAGEYARILFGKTGHEATLGVRFLKGDTAFRDYDYTGWEGSLRTVFKLPCAVELAPFASFRQDEYKGPATALELKSRTDETLRAGLALSWHITPSLSFDASWQYTDNASTSPLYTYKQNLTTLGMSWTF